MSIQKPSSSEEEYFAIQQALDRHRQAVKKSEELAVEERERRQKEHFMKCPKCGADLQSVLFRGITIDRCFGCNGSWLDAGELESLAGKGGDVVSRIVELFRGAPQAGRGGGGGGTAG